MPALRQSLQRTKVLIDTSTPYQIGGGKHNFGEKRHLLEEFNMADEDKKRDKCQYACINLHAQM